MLGEDDGRKPNTDSPNDVVSRVWREQFQMNHMNSHKHKTENDGKCDTESIYRTEVNLPEKMNGDITENGLPNSSDNSSVDDRGDMVLKGKVSCKDNLSSEENVQSSGR